MAEPAELRRELVTDVLMLAIVAAFFVLAGALVVGCDRILGHDDGIGAGDAFADEPDADDLRAATR